MIASTDEELSLTRHWVACLPQVNEWPHLVPLRDRLSPLSRGGNWALLFTLPRSHSWKVAEFESRSVCPGLWWVSTRPRSNDHVKRRNVSALLTSRCLLNRVLQRPVLQAEQGDAAQARARRELTPVSRGRSAGRCARSHHRGRRERTSRKSRAESGCWKVELTSLRLRLPAGPSLHPYVRHEEIFHLEYSPVSWNHTLSN